MKFRTSKPLATVLVFLPLAALAHTGQGDHGFLDGFVHPFLGLDHLLAMLVVGVWSVQHARHIGLAPLCFVTLLTTGAILGQQGLIVPQLEPLVAASVLVLGVMLTRPFKMVLPAALGVIGGFALFHGMAHGGELSSGNSVLLGIVLFIGVVRSSFLSPEKATTATVQSKNEKSK